MAQEDRHHRQRMLPQVGNAGQAALARAHVAVVGCGALGSAAVDLLARAGVGAITIIDRDLVELTNLQRQTLYSMRDIGSPKAEAARRRVAEIDPSIRCRGWVEHLDADNALSYLGDVDLILDGLDNFRTRYLLNDLAVRRAIPYLYGGALGAQGLTMPVLPGEACLRCIFPEPPPPGTGGTCDTAGILMGAVVSVAAQQSTDAMKWITGARDQIDRALRSFDVWGNHERRTPIASARRADCPCCGQHRFEFLEGAREDATTVLCGRNAVQVRPAAASHAAELDLDAAASRLSPHGDFRTADRLLVGTFRDLRTAEGGEVELTLFPDGRAIVRGSTDTAFARTVYERFVGA